MASGTEWAVNGGDANWAASVFIIRHLLSDLFSCRRFANLHPLQTTRRRYATEKPVTTHNELPSRWQGLAQLPDPSGSMQMESMTSSTRATRGSSCRPRICSLMYTSLLEVSLAGSCCFCLSLFYLYLLIFHVTSFLICWMDLLFALSHCFSFFTSSLNIDVSLKVFLVFK